MKLNIRTLTSAPLEASVLQMKKILNIYSTEATKPSFRQLIESKNTYSKSIKPKRKKYLSKKARNSNNA